jgi:hypothetical protein
MNDPLNLQMVDTPAPTRARQVAPSPQLSRLVDRISNNPGADSLDTRVSLLMHLVYLTYLDLKEQAIK